MRSNKMDFPNPLHNFKNNPPGYVHYIFYSGDTHDLQAIKMVKQ